MSDKSLGLKMLFWAQVIVCARVILFFIPVLMNKYMARSLVPFQPGDCFILLVTAAVVLYLAAGIIALIGYKRWRLFYALAAAVVVLLTAGLCDTARRAQAPLPAMYFLPAVLALAAALGAVLFPAKKSH